MTAAVYTQDIGEGVSIQSGKLHLPRFDEKWEVRRLGDIASFFKGSGLSKSDITPDGKRPCIHYGQLFTTYGEQITKVVSGTNLKGSFFLSLPNDVLMPASDVTPNGLATASCLLLSDIILGGDVLVIRSSENTLNGEFLAYVIKTHRDKILRLVSGTTVFHLYGRDLSDFRFSAPSVAEQTAIAGVLSDVEELLKSLDALIARKRAIKQAAMQQLLSGRTRLPGFDGKWTSLNMARDSNLKARIGWQGLTTEEYLTTGDYYLVTGTDFSKGRVDWTRCSFVDRARFVQDHNIQLLQDDVLITKDGTIGKVGFVDALPGPATLNSGIFVIRPQADAYFPLYMYYVLTSHIFNDFLSRLQAGSTISHLYQKDFVDFNFMAPPVDEQHAVATVLCDMDAEIAALERRRDKIRDIKQGIMQQLLSGSVRLAKRE